MHCRRKICKILRQISIVNANVCCWLFNYRNLMPDSLINALSLTVQFNPVFSGCFSQKKNLEWFIPRDSGDALRLWKLSHIINTATSTNAIIIAYFRTFDSRTIIIFNKAARVKYTLLKLTMPNEKNVPARTVRIQTKRCPMHNEIAPFFSLEWQCGPYNVILLIKQCDWNQCLCNSVAIS